MESRYTHGTRTYFTSLASCWGKLLFIDSRTRNQDFHEFARLKVQVTSPVMISVTALIKVDDVTFYLTVLEDTSRGHPWCQNLRKGNQELSSLSVTRVVDSIINIMEAPGQEANNRPKSQGMTLVGVSGDNKCYSYCNPNDANLEHLKNANNLVGRKGDYNTGPRYAVQNLAQEDGLFLKNLRNQEEGSPRGSIGSIAHQTEP
ncbi:hypothetical protein Ancab_023062 [Ancistrocladus abbreviatus]